MNDETKQKKLADLRARMMVTDAKGEEIRARCMGLVMTQVGAHLYERGVAEILSEGLPDKHLDALDDGYILAAIADPDPPLKRPGVLRRLLSRLRRTVK